jgi:hypothetical protein
MNSLIENKVIRGFRDRRLNRFFPRSATIITGYEFRRCHFIDCYTRIVRDVKKRLTIQDIRLLNCQTTDCTLNSAVLKNVIVDGLQTDDLLQTWGVAFSNVILKGKLGRLMISPWFSPGIVKSEVKEAYNKENLEFYNQIDWALDISEAKFVECTIRGIPSKLIRRDPESQVVITRDKAEEGEWKKIDLSHTYWPTAIEFFLELGRIDPDVVLVAPKAHPRYWHLLDGLKKLREAKIAEPD